MNGPWSRAVQRLWPEKNMFKQPQGETNSNKNLRTSDWFQALPGIFPTEKPYQKPRSSFWCPGSTGYCLWFQAIESQYLKKTPRNSTKIHTFQMCFEWFFKTVTDGVFKRLQSPTSSKNSRTFEWFFWNLQTLSWRQRLGMMEDKVIAWLPSSSLTPIEKMKPVEVETFQGRHPIRWPSDWHPLHVANVWPEERVGLENKILKFGPKSRVTYIQRDMWICSTLTLQKPKTISKSA